LLSLRHHAALLILLVLPLGLAAQQIPAGYESELTIPDGIKGLNLPTAVYYEPRHGELYVVDTGNGRIVLFDRNGTYAFEFTDSEHIPAPVGLVVDSLGHIMVLSDHQASTLHVYDYNGTYLHDIALADSHGTPVAAASITIDDQDHLYVLSAKPGRIFIFSTAGSPRSSFALPADSTMAEFPILGAIAWLGNHELAVPMPGIPEVGIFSPAGAYLRSVGIAGGDAGSLAFPVAAATDGKGGYMVLDKHRHTLIHFDSKGAFVKEFGGMGVSKGWFYHPSSLASDGAGRCFVLQSFQDRVQIFRIPDVAGVNNASLSVADPKTETAPAADPVKKN
jgi:hypothetical protein